MWYEFRNLEKWVIRLLVVGNQMDHNLKFIFCWVEEFAGSSRRSSKIVWPTLNDERMIQDFNLPR